MNRERQAQRGLYVAQIVCALAVIMVAVTGFRARRPAEPVTSPRTRPARVASVSERTGPEIENLSPTIALAPFSPQREPAVMPYRIERATNAPVASAPPQTIILLGTVVSASGTSFAMCQVGGQRPRVVYPRQQIGGLTLQSVSQGAAVFTDDNGSRVVLRVVKAGG